MYFTGAPQKIPSRKILREKNRMNQHIMDMEDEWRYLPYPKWLNIVQFLVSRLRRYQFKQDPWLQRLARALLRGQGMAAIWHRGIQTFEITILSIVIHSWYMFFLTVHHNLSWLYDTLSWFSTAIIAYHFLLKWWWKRCKPHVWTNLFWQNLTRGHPWSTPKMSPTDGLAVYRMSHHGVWSSPKYWIV